MIGNYLTIAWRHIARHKGYAALNILGLSIGIAACLLILQYVSFELSYEDFQVNKNRIYRVQQDRYDNGKLSTQWVAGAFAVGNSFKEQIPEIEDYVKVLQRGEVVTQVDNQPVRIQKMFYASSSFFTLFTYPLIAGDKLTALKEPYTVAVNASTAKKLFKTTDVVGKILRLNGKDNYTITAVFNDAPTNTQLQPDILISYSTFVKGIPPGNSPEKAWQWDGCLTYLLLRPGTDIKAVEKKFIPIVENATGADMKKYNAAVTYHLQPLTDIHLYSNYMMEPATNGDGKTTYLLAGIAFFIVLIAWVNYVNLATARAITRAREVGIRKAIGSQKGQLIAQFLTESALLNALAIALALLLVLVSIPGFNAISGQHLSFTLFITGSFWLGLSCLFIIGVFFSGLYPAFILSGFKPVEVLKGKLDGSRQRGGLRRSLVVFQFTASLFLLIATVAVYRQISFMKAQGLGMQVDQTLVIKRPIVGMDSTYPTRLIAFEQALRQQSSVKDITVSTSIPGEPVDWNAGGIKLVGADESTQKQYRVIGVDYDYINAYQLKLIAGRNFSRSFGSDDSAVVFNRKGIEQLGFNNPEEALGKMIDFWGRRYTVVGVTENFHQQSLRETYEPLILRFIKNVSGYVSIKTSAAHAAQTIDHTKRAWDQYFPGNTFNYFFLDEHFDAQYKADQRFGTVFALFTGLAILVSCLGLFGLASFTITQRTKEIGIRKVLGASVSSILQLLYREFVLLLLVAFLITIPLAWLMIHQWLQNYAFRISVHWSYFLLPFLAIAGVALLTVSVQTVKAAMANPVKSLKTE